MFPGFKDVIRKPGFLQQNVEQHHTFDPGLKELITFANDTTANNYSFVTLQGIIESFAIALLGHLHAEIASLIAVQPYNSEGLLRVYRTCEAVAGEQDKVQDSAYQYL